MYIVIVVEQGFIQEAKRQVDEFSKTPKGSYRYSDVDAWKGVVCELVVSRWLEKNFNVEKKAKGVDTSGLYDKYDLIIDGNTVEIKSATESYYKYIMPKKHAVDMLPKDIYICARYTEIFTDVIVEVLGFTFTKNIQSYPVKKNKGAEYYEVPISQLYPIKDLKKCFNTPS